MEPTLKIGDRVETVDDIISGTVVAISREWITVESPDGFHFNFLPTDLIRVSGALSISSAEVAQARAEEENTVARKAPAPRRKERNSPKMEVDLHASQLLPSTRGMSNHDILNLQLETARRQLEFAIEKRISKVVFIHGVGEGSLKEELAYLFRRYDNLRYYDAEYQKYGLGATEVYIYQKS